MASFPSPSLSTAAFGTTLLSEQDKKGLKITATTLAEVDAAETINITAGIEKLTRQHYSAEELLNTAWILKSHKTMLGVVWDWPGKLRTTDTNIGVPPYEIRPKLRQLTDDTKTWIEFNAYPDHEIIARFHHGLVMIHPFPNGNGRWSRQIASMLAQSLGLKVNWTGMASKEGKQEYINALRTADGRDYTKIISFIQCRISDKA